VKTLKLYCDERMRMALEGARIAYYDVLTGLPNRTLLQDGLPSPDGEVFPRHFLSWSRLFAASQSSRQGQHASVFPVAYLPTTVRPLSYRIQPSSTSVLPR
jgi:hypothetical protein